MLWKGERYHVHSYILSLASQINYWSNIHQNSIPANIYIYLFRVNNRKGKKRSEICSNLTIKTPECRHYIHLFKGNNRNTGKRCVICSKLTMKTAERRYWCCTGVFIVNIERISHLFLVFLLLNFAQVTVNWEG